MEYIGQNPNINSIELAGFIHQILRKKPAASNENGSWSEVKMDDEESSWGEVIFNLSQIDGCEKLIKTNSEGEALILFLCNDTSVKNVRRINKKYAELLDNVDIYFDLLILDSNEIKSWADNINNVVCWEKNA